MTPTSKSPGKTGARAASLRLAGLACAFATALACGAPATAAENTATKYAATEYVVRPGDVLSLMFVGGGGANYNIPVEIDGLAWFPIIGGISVSGSTMAEVRSQIADAYSATSISADSSLSTQLLRPNQVHVGVAEYRPIYVGGFGQPVVLAYRPGLTLRQALTMAGSQQGSPETASDVTDRINVLTYELGRIETRIWRLRTILGEASPGEFQEVFGSRSPDVQQLASLERSMVEALEAEKNRRRQVLQADIRQTEGRINTLLAQREIELEAQRLDDELAKNSRLAPTSQMADLQRAALSSATRVLQLDVEIESARSRLTELKGLEGELTAGIASDGWSELADQLALYYQTEAEISALRSSTPVDDEAIATRVVITRDTGETIQTTVYDTTQILPGDVIELVAERTAQPYATSDDGL